MEKVHQKIIVCLETLGSIIYGSLWLCELLGVKVSIDKFLTNLLKKLLSLDPFQKITYKLHSIL